ncbi:MAG: TolC family protein [Candidatus Euphemobacter frigidus]|nr:TolC family protein [Candidatus Euphemobacter frigidus]MDP8275529.1 TolC family protein [Candidatus Euphemobacter frigidus]
MKIIWLTVSLHLFSILIGMGLASGEERKSAPVYSLADCLRMADKNNPVILKARQEMEVASGKRLQALSEAIPHLKGEAGYTYLNTINTYETEEGELALNLHDNYRAGLTLEQNLYKGGKIFAGIKASLIYDRYSEVYLREAGGTVVFRVKELFNHLLLARKIVEVRETTVEHMEDYLQITEKKYDQGTASEFDLITARVRLANSRPPLIEASNRVDILKTTLAKEMGREDQDYEIEGSLALTPFSGELNDLNRLGLEHRALIEQVLLNEEIMEQNLRASSSGYQPSLSLFAAYEGEQPRYGLPPEDRFEFEWTAGATLKWNIFDGLMTPGLVREARGQYEQARIETRDTRRTVLLSIKQAYLDLKAARKVVESHRETVGQAEKAYKIARIRWENGISTSLELTDAELNQSEASIMLQEALTYYRIALAKLERAVGLTIKEIKATLQPKSEELTGKT